MMYNQFSMTSIYKCLSLIVIFQAVLENFHLTLDPNELELLRWSVTIVEEQFLAGLDDALCKDSNAVISIHHNHLRVTIWINGMIGKSDFVSLACGIHNEVVIQIEEKAARIFVVDLPTSVSFILCDYFTAIFANEFILLSSVLEEDSPASDITWSHQKMFSQSALNADILACHLC